ncbi:MAG: hypothetical protein HZB39_03580 [Planctomycetes bacterium]|nr:hypothetical protein [Planctomycetota bacterium]
MSESITPLRALTLFAVVTVFSPAARSQEPVSFRTDVLPILEERCFDCHQATRTDARGRTKKHKGGLRLDGNAWILRGGDGGDVVVAGKPDDSPLLTRAELDEDDPDHMPDRGDPLTVAQLEVIRRWIASGASFGDWTGAPLDASAASVPVAQAGATVPAGARAARLLALADGLAPLSEAERKALGEAGAHVEDLLGDRRLFRIGFPGRQASIDDAALRVLDRVKEHVVELDLARTPIDDSALDSLARLPRLSRLDLSDTRISAAGLRKLTRAASLRTLVLVGTTLHEDAVGVLAGMPHLETVHLWRSGLGDGELAALRDASPQLRVVGPPSLPPPEAPSAGRDGPRRRR